MKKFTFIVLILSMIVININSVHGQLSGTLVIGGAPSDYTTFSDAVTALNTSGVSGDVVFEIKPGTYSEQFSINQISGAGQSATITFQPQNGDSSSVILQYASSSVSANNYVIQLNGADYVTFDKLTIIRSDTLKYCKVIDFMGGARKNTFSNCIIEGNANPGNTQLISAVIGSNNTGFKSRNTFENNIIRNGSYGLYFTGQNSTTPDSNIIVRNNKFIDQSNQGIHIESHRFAFIEANEVTNNTTNNSYNAIFLRYSNDTMRVVKNKIALSTGYGIYIWNCNEVITANALIANNFVSIGGTSNAIGIYILSSKRLYILHNSINIFNTITIQGSCIHINGSSTANLYIKNNIFANAGTGQGYTYYVAGTTNTPIAEADYNDLFVNSGVWIGYWKTAGITSLANWRTISSMDAHSFIANPNYFSTSDLHTISGGINGMGTPNLAPFVISTDIDNDVRDASTPDVGADEFNIGDLGIAQIELPDAGVYCKNTAFNVKVSITNHDISNYNGNVPVYYKVGGSAAVNETATNLSIPAGDTVSYTFATDEIVPVAGTYKFFAGTDLEADNNMGNDTMSRMIEVIEPAVANFSYMPNIDEVIFTNTSSNAVNYSWDFGDGNNSVEENPTHTYAGVGEYTVILEASNTCSSDTATQLISLSGINELMELYGIKWWPNPATKYLNILCINNKTNLKALTIYNCSGKLILRNVHTSNNTMQTIDISFMNNGIYVIKFEVENKILYQKVLINK